MAYRRSDHTPWVEPQSYTYNLGSRTEVAIDGFIVGCSCRWQRMIQGTVEDWARAWATHMTESDAIVDLVVPPANRLDGDPLTWRPLEASE